MSGIAGALGKRDRTLIERMTQAIYHRAPATAGHFRSLELDLGIRGLATFPWESNGKVVDSLTRDSRIVFDGNIHNRLELRRFLSARGHRFEAMTDAEVVIHLYQEYGERCVDHLRGAFAFAIADGSTLFIARDRLGIKPLYYVHLRDADLFLFGSEIKALLQCAELRPAIHKQTLADFLVLGHPFGDETFFEGIKCLRAGHYMRVRMRPDGIEVNESEYYRPALNPDDSLNYEECEETLISLLDGSLRTDTGEEVDTGLALSGGINSSLLAILLKKHRPHAISTFTVTGDRSSPDAEQSRAIARSIGSAHTEIVPEFEDYLSALPYCVLASEQPFSIIPLPFFILSREAGRRVELCFTGDGADVVLGGLHEYFDRSAAVSRMQTGLATALELRLCPVRGVVSMVESLSEDVPPDEYLRRCYMFNIQGPLARGFLEPFDKLTMAAGVQTRMPFLGDTLVDFASTLPLSFKVNRDLSVGKYILKRAALKLPGKFIADSALRQKVNLTAASSPHLPRFTNLCSVNLSDGYVEGHEWGSYFLGMNQSSRRTAKRNLLLFDLFCFIFITNRGAVPDNFDMLQFIKSRSSTRAGTGSTS